MLTRFNRSGPPALALNIAVWTGLTVLMNGLIFGLGWDQSVKAPFPVAFEPPGWVVGLVWTAALFPLMAGARWRLRGDAPGTVRARRWVTALLIGCLVWPFGTLALGSLVGGLIGNLAVWLLTLIAAALAWPVDRRSTGLLVPVALWVTFATLIVLTSLGWI